MTTRRSLSRSNSHHTRAVAVALTLAVASALVMPASVWSDDTAAATDQRPTEIAYDPSSLSEQGFVRAESPASDGVPGGALMLAAYLALFALLGGYSVTLARRHSTISADLGALRRRVEDLDDRLDAIAARRGSGDGG